MDLLLQEIPVPKKIDSIDRALMSFLSKNPTVTYDEMARHIGKAKGTVHNRLERLKREKIVNPAYVIDYEQLGFDDALVRIQIDVYYLSEVSSYLKLIPEIVCLYHITGDYDILAIVRCTDRKHLHCIVEKIIKNKHISRTNTSLILHHLKGSAIDIPEREAITISKREEYIADV
ncbi:MAG: Lrp/AsnC family transcriptional regulator [Candidatus Hodarchaeota archaeon]